MTIALLTACSEPSMGIRSRVVQELLDEASADPQAARQVLTTLLTASVMSLEAYTRATHRSRQEVLQTLGVSWSQRTLEV
jgi:acetyl-CoA carboxylase alpha subunit